MIKRIIRMVCGFTGHRWKISSMEDTEYTRECSVCDKKETIRLN